MKGYFLTCALFFAGLSVFSQNLELDIHKNKLADFIAIEKSIGSENFKLNSEYVSRKDIAQPIAYRRKEKGIPDLISFYFYFQSDSVISYILYEWDGVNFPDYQDTAKIPPREIKAFIKKDRELYAGIARQYGAAKSQGDLTDLSKIETGDFERTDFWHPNDSTEIDLYTILSNKYEKRGAITTTPTAKIRLFVRNTARGKAQALPVAGSISSATNGSPVATSLGFEDTAFSRFFKRLTGGTPATFRASHLSHYPDPVTR